MMYKPSLSLYISLKDSFDISPYLLTMFNTRRRNTLAKIRLASHQLNIVTGRHKKIERNNRKCTLSELNEIEDEYLFILICPCFKISRIKYIQKYYYDNPNMFKLT